MLFNRIVIPTDFSECSRDAWDLAKRLGATGSELILLHVVSEIPRFGEGLLTAQSASEIDAAVRRWAEASLAEWVAEARSEGLKVRSALHTGVPYQGIVDLARDERADLIVIGTRGRSGMDRLLMGSVADRVIRLAPCAVLTVREPS